MKPLPNLSDDAAMILRGKRSALAASRAEATAALRDAYTSLDGCAWPELGPRAEIAGACIARLLAVVGMWHAVTAEADEANMRGEQGE